MQLLIPDPLYSDLAHRVFADPTVESAALLKARVSRRGGRVRLLAYEVAIPHERDYIARSATRVSLRPDFYVPFVSQAARDGECLAFVHSHPHAIGIPEFSPIDDSGEVPIRTYLNNRAPDNTFLSALLSPAGARSRVLGTSTLVPVVRVGSSVVVDAVPGPFDVEVMNRQVLAFGVEGQSRVSALAVAIIGLGGTGSLVAQQLAYLGVSRFVLIDFDRVEASNINRLVGARRDDVGSLKVDVAARLIRAVSPSATVTVVADDVLRDSVVDHVITADLAFACTDSHGSRALLNQIAYQYLLPCFDVGVAIAVRDGAVTHIAGRAQMLSPGLPCLACGNLLDPESVRLDFLPESSRKNEPYFTGAGVAQPAVVTINGIVASLATTMYLSAVAGIPGEARLQLYDGVRGVVRNATYDPVPNCVVCSGTRGALAKGDEWLLPVRP